MKKQFVCIVFHTTKQGHEIEPFHNKKDAEKFMQEILDEYTEEYGEEVTRENIYEIAEGCNLEYLEKEIR